MDCSPASKRSATRSLSLLLSRIIRTDLRTKSMYFERSESIAFA